MGFWLPRGNAAEFKRLAKRQGGVTKILRRFVASYLRRKSAA